MTDEAKKNIFDKLVDAVTDRDEKAAAEASRLEAIQKATDKAMEDIAAKQKAIAELKAQAEADARAKVVAEAKLKADAEAKARAAAEVQAKAEAEAKRQEEVERQAQLKAQQETRAEETARIAAEKARAALPRHTVVPNDTLSAIALKHYGHATEPYWRLIYEANKEAIGANPGVVRPGTELVIPEVPADLKK